MNDFSCGLWLIWMQRKHGGCLSIHVSQMGKVPAELGLRTVSGTSCRRNILGPLKPLFWLVCVFRALCVGVRNHTWLWYSSSGKPPFQLSSSHAPGALCQGPEVAPWTSPHPVFTQAWEMGLGAVKETLRVSAVAEVIGRCSVGRSLWWEPPPVPAAAASGAHTAQGPCHLGSRAPVLSWQCWLLPCPAQSKKTRLQLEPLPHHQACLSRK